MRKLLISLLLASAAASPAIAARQSSPDEVRAERERAREERQQARQERQQRQQSNTVTQSVGEERVRPERPQRHVDTVSGGDGPQIRQAQPMQQDQQMPVRVRRADRQAIDRGTAMPNVAQRQQMFEQRRERRDQRLDTMRQERIELQQAMRHARPPVISGTPLPNTQPPPPVAARPSSVPSYHWNSSSWRHDKRYDWHKHRNKFWWLFQLGYYYDPFGWGYSPYQIGWRMWPSYYSSNYWINDPWQYRLPYAPPGTRWIRYWDDAVLVDTWSGQVVDVIYNFFW